MKTIGLLLAVFILFAVGISAQDTGSSTTAASTAKTEKRKSRSQAFRPTKSQIKSGQQTLIDAKLFPARQPENTPTRRVKQYAAIRKPTISK